MSMKINYNVSAIIANNALKVNDNKLTASLGRLSSGYKINNAKDNAAGLAISRRMNAQIKGLKAAQQDSKDGISVVEIADGALAEVHDILQRMNELAIKSANGTMVDNDRAYIQQEIESLAEEIDRIGMSTEYNGQALFTGKFDLKGYTNDVRIKVDTYSDSMGVGIYEFDLESIRFEIDENGTAVLSQIDTDGTGLTSNNVVNVKTPFGTTEEYRVSGDNYHLKFTGKGGDEFTLDIAMLNKESLVPIPTDAGATYDLFPGTATPPDASVTRTKQVEITGYGAMTFQVGANEGQTIDIRFKKLSMESLGFKNQDSDPNKNMTLNLGTAQGALKGIDQITEAITMISSMRSSLGAYQNRLEHTNTNLATSEENMTAAYSRIMDTDMSEEMTDYSNLQIISQASTAILAQANERPSKMLQLLQ